MARKLKPVHPGEMLREEFMKPLGLSMNRLAMDLHVPVTRIAEIVKERRGITADTALRLGRYFKNSAEFWIKMQKHYELEVARDAIAEKIDRNVHPFEPASTR
jgi:addiction module HigA family antidote